MCASELHEGLRWGCVRPGRRGQPRGCRLENIEAVLAQAEMASREVVEITRYYTESGGGDVVRELLQGWNLCTTTLGVERPPLPGAKIMYEVIAAVPGG